MMARDASAQKRRRADWALHGGSPRFPVALRWGQQAFPHWAKFEAAMADLFERQYYTNHGPLARRFEVRLAALLGRRHAVCVANDTIAMLMAAEALDRKGPVLVPAQAGRALLQGLAWAGLTPRRCPPAEDAVDVDRAGLDAACAGGAPPVAVLAIAGGGPLAAVAAWADARGLPLLIEASASLGCATVAPASAADAGRLRVLSLHADELLNTMEGGCIATDDDALAARLRNIRSSYGAGPAVEVVRTSNGRISEAQAAIGLLNLDDLPRRLARNRERAAIYRAGLDRGLPGLRWQGPTEPATTNAQRLALQIEAGAFGLYAAGLRRWLAAEGVPTRVLAGPPGRAGLLLPQNAAMSDDDVHAVCALVRDAQACAAAGEG